ncbi:MAG: serine/threonine protein kinase [Firmicutes bacterium]|nr:serine/threonine protein kinase [Bacillota bacterium]MCM1401331.1 serine/threonine protein kinase [Bacteroides sp.]
MNSSANAATPNSVTSLTQGTILHGSNFNYVTERVLGQGSFGITYLASVEIKGSLGTLPVKVPVAIKEFCMQEFATRSGSTIVYGTAAELTGKYMRKFHNESINIGRLLHPGIVRVIDALEANGTAYYVMEFIEGPSLENFINSKGALSVGECVTIARGVGEALDYMHSQSMLHLDLKPGNIMLRTSGAPVLIDFGLSKTFDADGDTVDTQTSIGNGTSGYAPIEQSVYAGPVFGQALPVTMDVYALGATMYKMLTGRRPPEAPVVLNVGLPESELKKCGPLAPVIEQAMNPVVRHRTPSVNVLLQSLPPLGEKIVISEQSTAHGSSSSEPTSPLNLYPWLHNGRYSWHVFSINIVSEGNTLFGIRFSDFGNTLSIGNIRFKFKLKSGLNIPENLRAYIGSHPELLTHPGDSLSVSEPFAEITFAPDDDVPSLMYHEVCIGSVQSPSLFNLAMRFFQQNSVLKIFRDVWNKSNNMVPFPSLKNVTWIEFNYGFDLDITGPVFSSYRYEITKTRLKRFHADPALVSNDVVDEKISRNDFDFFKQSLALFSFDLAKVPFPKLFDYNASYVEIILFGKNNEEIDCFSLYEAPGYDSDEHPVINGGNIKNSSVREVVDRMLAILPKRWF